MGKLKMNKDGIKGLFIRHVEKMVLMMVLLVFGVLVYASLGLESLPASQTPDALSHSAEDAEKKIVDPANAKEVIATVTLATGYSKRVEDALIPTQSDVYAAAKPPAPFWGQDGVRRTDPKLLPPLKLEVAAIVGPAAYRMKSLDDDVFIKQENSVLKPKNPVRKSTRRNRNDPFGAGMEGMDPGMAAGGAPGMEGAAGMAGGMGMPGMAGGMGMPGMEGMAGGMAGGMGMQQMVTAMPQDRVGFIAGQGAVARPLSGILVKALVPVKDQFEEFKKTFATAMGYNPYRDMPVYASFTAQRAEVPDDPNAPIDWDSATVVAFTSKTTLETMNAGYYGYPQEAADPRALQYWSLTYPLPPFINRDLSALASHTEIPKLSELPKLEYDKLMTRFKEYKKQVDKAKKKAEEALDAKDAPTALPSAPAGGIMPGGMGGGGMPGMDGGMGMPGMGMPGMGMPGMGIPGMDGGAGMGMPGMEGMGMPGMGGMGMPGADMAGGMGMPGMGGMGMPGMEGMAGMGMPGMGGMGMPGMEGMGGMGMPGMGGMGMPGMEGMGGMGMPGMGGMGMPGMDGMGGMGMPGMGGMGMDYGMGQSSGPTIPYLLVRFFDSTAEPGKKYRYRVQLALQDPNHPLYAMLEPNDRFLDDTVKRRLAPIIEAEKAAKGKTRRWYVRTDWSEPSQPISVSIEPETFAGEVNPSRLVDVADKGLGKVVVDEPSAKLLVGVWDGNHAVDVATVTNVFRGSYLNFNADGDAIHPVYLIYKSLKKYDFVADRLVADIRGGEEVGNNERVLTPGEYVVIDDSGKIMVRNEVDDYDSFRKLALPVLPDPVTTGGMPGAEGADMGMPGMEGGMPGDAGGGRRNRSKAGRNQRNN